MEMLGKLKVLFLSGIIILFLPYIGIPDSWKDIGSIVFGVLIIYLTFALKYQYKVMKSRLNRLEQPIMNNDIQIHE